MGCCLSVRLSPPLDFQIPPCLPSPKPPFLLAGQALYYPGKSVCAHNLCVCVFVQEAKFQALTCRCRDAEEERGRRGRPPETATDRFPLVPKKQSGAAWPPLHALLLFFTLLCRSITLPITDVICH